MTADTYSLRKRLVWLLTSLAALIWLFSAIRFTSAHITKPMNCSIANWPKWETPCLPLCLQAKWITCSRNCMNTRMIPRYPSHLRYGTPTRPLVNSSAAQASKPWVNQASANIPPGLRPRFYSAQDDDVEYRVVVGQPHAARRFLAREIGLAPLLPAALALPMMALAIWWVVGRTRPGAGSGTGCAGADNALMKPCLCPTRLLHYVPAFNALIQRVTIAFENERRFTADAAHQSRTPLAALKIQAQVALRAQNSRQPATRAGTTDHRRRQDDARRWRGWP